jgi:hypothetical protein
MDLKHLTDEEIQDYLDGNLLQERIFTINSHLSVCELCKSEINQYKSLYTELSKKVNLEFSVNFSKNVIAKIHKESRSWLPNLSDTLLAIIGFAVVIGTIIYFVDFAPFLEIFKNIPGLQNYIDLTFSGFSVIKNFLDRMNLNFSLIIFTGLALFIIGIMDQFLKSRYKLISSIV